MKVILRRAVLEDLDRIHAWISKDNPSAAADMIPAFATAFCS
jgi:plasmid stabilization system protein ParE